MEADYPHTNAVIGDEGEGEHNHQGEKKSVMKKVKDKAMKIKDRIKKHGGHGHDHEEEDDDEDEETINASEVHGAPLQESGFISGTNLPKQTGLDLEDLNPTAEIYPPNVGDERGSTKTTVVYDHGGTGAVVQGMYDRSLRYGSDGSEVTNNPGDSQDKVPKIPDLQHNSNVTGVGDEVTTTPGMDSNVADPTVKIGPLEDLEEDPHRPKNRPPISNYQTKVVDPTGQGGKEADVSPLVQRLGNLRVTDESQFAPESDAIPPSKNPESPKTVDPARPESMPRDTIAGKISSATSAIADKAVSAKNAVASRLGYGEAGTNYGAAAAVDGGGGESDKGVSVREYLSEKLSPGEEDRALSAAITEAIHGYKPEDSGPESENTGSGPGVVGRVKGAVSSWLGMGTQTVEQDRAGLMEGAKTRQEAEGGAR